MSWGFAMVMSEQTGDSKRDGARIFGSIFQFLAFVSIFFTLYAMARIANLGNAFGINPANDPLIWFVLASGIFVTCVFIGMGYALGVLCAIYDRQEETEGLGVGGSAPGHPKPSPFRPSPPIPTTNFAPRPPPSASVDVHPSPRMPEQENIPKVHEKSALAEWLTRERHFRKSIGQ